jgi:hypothetical protein
VGVELEGGWRVLPPGVALEHDGSVFRDRAPAGFRIGEIPVGPIQPGALPRLLQKYYPQKVDRTCGMHVHMSFETVWQYSLLMDQAYQDTVIEYLTRWAKSEGTFAPAHHIWERLQGQSVFCQKKFWPDKQVQSLRKDHDQEREGHRYTIIHFCGRQMTVECRVLPMMDTCDQAVRAIRRLIDITNACLLVLGRKKEEVMKLSVDLPANEVFEEFMEEGL